jgi:hypothetical protein
VISIIVCSKNKHLSTNLKKNISETIGTEFEWICIKNKSGKIGISEAYNIGAKQSIGNILTFIHEDVIFHTKNWGLHLEKHLKDRSIGLIGSAGATYKSSQLSSWIDVPVKYYRSNLIQCLPNNQFYKKIRKKENSKLSEVVQMDGMFLIMRRDVWEEFPFDEKTFSGFHFYDLDTSMQIGQKYKLAVCHDVLIEHLSEGNFSQAWFEDALKFHEKWKRVLPTCCIKLSVSEKKRIEHQVSIKSLFYNVKFSHQRREILWGIIRVFYYRPFSRYNFLVLKKVFTKTSLS